MFLKGGKEQMKITVGELTFITFKSFLVSHTFSYGSETKHHKKQAKETIHIIQIFLGYMKMTENSK